MEEIIKSTVIASNHLTIEKTWMMFSKNKLLIEYFKVVLIGNLNYPVGILGKNDRIMLEFLTFSKIKVS